MKKIFLLASLAALILGMGGSFLGTEMRAQLPVQGYQRLLTESLGVTRGQYLVADLASFPDGATKLVLRDPNGRVGIILAVSGRAGAERAQIEFYGAGGQLVRTINASNASPSAGLLEDRVRRLEDLSLPIVHRPGERYAQSNTENLWIRLDALDGRVRALEGRR